MGIGGFGNFAGCGYCGHPRNTMALVHQIIMKEMELEMIKKEKLRHADQTKTVQNRILKFLRLKLDRKKGADAANQMSEVDSAMAVMN